MHIRVQKWGNSLAVRIPHKIAKEAHLCEGSEVDLTEDSGRLVIDRVETEPTLQELVERISKENLHTEFEFGSPRGREVW